MISPWARQAWELDHDPKAYETLITTAQTLATRYNPKQNVSGLGTLVSPKDTNLQIPV
jgi:hypothetical protein